jgi:hypothetical protein
MYWVPVHTFATKRVHVVYGRELPFYLYISLRYYCTMESTSLRSQSLIIPSYLLQFKGQRSLLVNTYTSIYISSEFFICYEFAFVYDHEKAQGGGRDRGTLLGGRRRGSPQWPSRRTDRAYPLLPAHPASRAHGPAVAAMAASLGARRRPEPVGPGLRAEGEVLRPRHRGARPVPDARHPRHLRRGRPPHLPRRRVVRPCASRRCGR